MTQEEAYAAVQVPSGSKNKESNLKKPLPASAIGSVKDNKVAAAQMALHLVLLFQLL